jgi:hypothetical protein
VSAIYYLVVMFVSHCHGCAAVYSNIKIPLILESHQDFDVRELFDALDLEAFLGELMATL